MTANALLEQQDNNNPAPPNHAFRSSTRLRPDTRRQQAHCGREGQIMPWESYGRIKGDLRVSNLIQYAFLPISAEKIVNKIIRKSKPKVQF